MTKYEILKNEMTNALKDGNKLRRATLADIVASIDKAAMAGKTRAEITDQFVDEILLKYQKTVAEMIETCPDNVQYAARKAEYREKASIVAEFAPKTITDVAEIEKIINYVCMCNQTMLTSGNKGQMMKLIMPTLKKEHCDMKVAQIAIANCCAAGDKVIKEQL